MASHHFDTTIMAIIAAQLILIFFFSVYIFSKRRGRVWEGTNNNVREQHGLDKTFLKTIGVIEFDPKSAKEGLQCAVCLSEVKKGEKTRVLPKCSHGFHMECVDMWFHSHATCPICRNPVVDQPEILDELEDSITVLVEGDEAGNHHKGSFEVASSSSSSSSSTSLVTIEIVTGNSER